MTEVIRRAGADSGTSPTVEQRRLRKSGLLSNRRLAKQRIQDPRAYALIPRLADQVPQFRPDQPFHRQPDRSR